MTSERTHKKRTTRLGRLFRLLRSVFDPRAYAHGLKVLNYYNYTHVAELRRITRKGVQRISPTASFANGHNIVLGDRVHIGAGVSLWAGSGSARIVIGDDTLIAPSVMLTAANYRYDDGSPINDQAMDEADIVIGRDVWLGYGAVILAGVRIGDGAIIGAGAVVRSDIPDFAIVAGNPGKVIGRRRRPGDDEVHVPGAADAVDETVLAVIRRESGADEARLTGPLDQSGIDSFDLITLRVSLESQFARSIPDREWAGIASLADIAKLPSLKGPRQGKASVADPEPRPGEGPRDAGHVPFAETRPTGQAMRRYGLGMPQMALSGLSEPWLFKEVGDIHWAMISSFLGSPSSGITDDQGDRLYATFTRIGLQLEPSLRGFRENEDLSIASSLDRYGAGFFFGTHELSAGTARGRVRTMSTFAKYGERGQNTSLIKGSPTITHPDRLPSLDAFPDFGVEYRERRAADPGPAIYETEYDILAPHDINGVGLLYFAAYPTIFDLCIERHEGKGFLLGHSTVSKDILYFANSEPTETLVFRLHARHMDDGLIRHTATLSRKSDGHRMSEVLSIKRPL